jgi:hypothetical protein
MIQIQELDRKEYSGARPPEHLTDLLTQVGGRNEFGEPNFRLVRAEERLTPSGGVWVDWPQGASLADRNESRGAVPWRRTIGVRMIRRYGPNRGWVLERWCPPKMYGTRERWYAPAIVGGTVLVIKDGLDLRYVPSQGTYPSQGDYEYAGFTFPAEALAEATVLPAVQELMRSRDAVPKDPAKRAIMRAQIAKMAADSADEAWEKWAMEMLTDAGPAFGGKIMSGYGPKKSHSMNAIAKKLGIREHTGRS